MGLLGRLCCFINKFHTMKKIYLLTLGVVASAASFAQVALDLEINPTIETQETLPVRGTDISSLRGTTNCIDTVDYALYRSLDGTNTITYATVTLEDSATTIKGMGLFFPKEGTQNITMSGFELQAVGLRADGVPSQTIVSVYAAGADSLPTGTPLTTQTISMDTSTSRSFADRFMVHTFTPITISTSFVVTVESGSPIDSVDIWTGGVLTGSFDGYPTSLSFGGAWLRPQGTAQVGEIIPRFHPIISYDATNTLAASVLNLTTPNETVVFTSTFPEVGRSILAFSGLLQDNNTAAIIFGDGLGILNPTISESHSFVDETLDYTVVLSDSILLYQSNIGVCVVNEVITLKGTGPNSVNDLTGNDINAFVSENVIHVQNAEGLVTIYSITGAVVKKAYVSANSETIDVSDLNEGIYILSVNDRALKLRL